MIKSQSLWMGTSLGERALKGIGSLVDSDHVGQIG